MAFTKGNWIPSQERAPAETDSFKIEVSCKLSDPLQSRTVSLHCMVTYDHPFAWIIHAHMLWRDITGSCLVSGKPGLGGFSEQSSRGCVPGGAYDGSDHVSRAQTALCINCDTSQGEGRMGWGWGQPREGGNLRKFRPLLQTQRLYKYEGPPHPPSTVGMAARKGRSVMKWGGNRVAWRAKAGGLHMSQYCTHTREGTHN